MSDEKKPGAEASDPAEPGVPLWHCSRCRALIPIPEGVQAQDLIELHHLFCRVPLATQRAGRA